MMRNLMVATLALGLAGCVNFYNHVDTAPDGTAPLTFRGIRDYLRDNPRLHVMQIHGMGDHSFQNDCGEGSENLELQEAIAKRLGYHHAGDYDRPVPMEIEIDQTVAGTYSVSKFVGANGGELFFSCVTWGETSKIIKQGLLELDERFLEKNENERHRALLNRKGKKFVNTSFADPVIYLGKMGPYIRRVVWEGINLSIRQHAQIRVHLSKPSSSAELVAKQVQAFAGGVPTVVISDSLGSRVVFDVLCSKGGAYCRGGSVLETLPASALASRTRDLHSETQLAQSLGASIQSVYMLANQLPLLELAYVPSPDAGTPLEDVVADTKCYQPLLGVGEQPANLQSDQNPDAVQVVAFTDVNDLLSYHLSETFKDRCTSADIVVDRPADAITGQPAQKEVTRVKLPVEIINVTLPNARARWLFVASNPVKAHSGGFKTNRRAIKFLVDGND